jgi:hypothetical protein
VQFFWFAVVLARINSELWVGRAALYNLMCAFVCVGAAARRPWYATLTRLRPRLHAVRPGVPYALCGFVVLPYIRWSVQRGPFCMPERFHFSFRLGFLNLARARSSVQCGRPSPVNTSPIPPLNTSITGLLLTLVLSGGMGLNHFN